MVEILKWVLIIEGKQRDEVIHFESNYNPDDVRRTAISIARLRGINLKERKHKIMSEAEYQASIRH
ncbi:hypothetical protein [Piscirickettsia litoralis]|uniref:Uncharacterized protein n=1 Tax=Piscirickettsia litoralis TaxID=1891921 RepID=A0ABX2ZY27_9GAMM|nr:hypothetical protein [Piscirickettsia litoralis]ODN41501.1 hypothetical protein BGC07_15445 [Piscirickettsia litoralis]ODN41574.1 hypothetical protein BGC07_15835 [Piscirickettsia litoralis]